MAAGKKSTKDLTVDVVVEIPQGSRNKFEWDEVNRVIRLDRRIPSAVAYPTHYGFVPGTVSVDGDPLDALVVAEGPLYPGVWLTARPIGVGWVGGDDELEPKLLCVPDADPTADGVQNLDDVPKLLLEEIGQFFDVYQLLEPTRTRRMQRWGERGEAQQTVRDARRAHRKAHRGEPKNDAALVIELLCERGEMMAVAESCTGGLVAAAIAATDGAGECFRGGIVAYDSEVKHEVLHVSRGRGVINAGAAQEMASCVRQVLGADVGLATTGVVGPDTREGQPVGTIWVGIACDDHTAAEHIKIATTDPNTVRAEAADVAVTVLARRLDCDGAKSAQ